MHFSKTLKLLRRRKSFERAEIFPFLLFQLSPPPPPSLKKPLCFLSWYFLSLNRNRFRKYSIKNLSCVIFFFLLISFIGYFRASIKARRVINLAEDWADDGIRQLLGFLAPKSGSCNPFAPKKINCSFNGPRPVEREPILKTASFH